MLAKPFLLPSGRAYLPDRFHLFATSELAHGGIIEVMLAFRILGRPQNGFCRVSEVAAGKIRRRIGLFPRDVVEDFEAQLLHRVTNRKDDMLRASDPNGA